MRLQRREAEVFSLSFLDCICCGFGAIILLLVLTKFGEPRQLEESRENLRQQLVRLEEELHTIRGETEALDRELEGRRDDLVRERRAHARVSGELSSVAGEYSESRKDAAVTNIIESELVAAYEGLKEQEAKLRKTARRRPPTDAIGGIPVDSEYIIFVIDTSGSMLTNHWDAAVAVLREILDIYPQVRGLQVLDDEGRTMLQGTRGKWLDDSSAQRARIVGRMKSWRAFSNSNPVEGIEEAMKTYYAQDKRISIYVIGDEFSGDSIQVALDSVDRINPPDAQGKRRVRIHAVGFPEGPGMTAFTSQRFAALMRAMCDRNGGTFVGITSEKPCAGYVEVFGVRQCVGGS